MNHEPHCPVPRNAKRDEGAVCLCRKPEIYLVWHFAHGWESEHQWEVRGIFLDKAKAIEFAKTLCKQEDDQASVTAYQLNMDHPTGGRRVWNDYSWKHPELGIKNEE